MYLENECELLLLNRGLDQGEAILSKAFEAREKLTRNVNVKMTKKRFQVS